MKHYDDFKSMDEMIAHYMPKMREDHALRAQRRKERGWEPDETDLEQEADEEKKKHVEDLYTLLYIMENMPREEREGFYRKYGYSKDEEKK